MTMEFIITPEKTAITNGVCKSAKVLSERTTSQSKILDYGCGKLRNAKYLLNEGFKTSVLDTQKQLDSLSENDLDLFENVFSAEDLKIEIAGKYDAILCAFVLNVIPDESIRVDILNNIYSLLNDNGTFYLEVRGTAFIKQAKHKIEFNDGYLLGNGKTKTFQKGFTKESLTDLINKSRLNLIEIKRQGDGLIAICKK